MQIDKELVTYLETLGRIELSEEQRAETEKDLQSILDYIDTEDEVTNTARAEEILQNAPDSREGCFAVPKTVE